MACRLKEFVILSLCCSKLFFVQSSEQDSLKIEHLDSDIFENVEVNYDYFYGKDEPVEADLSDRVQSEDQLQKDGSKDQEQFYESVQTANNNQRYSVFCSEDSMKIVLPSGPLSEVKLFGVWGMESVLEAPVVCGYSLIKKQDKNILRVSYSGCGVTVEDGSYILRVLYRDDSGHIEVLTASCDASSSGTASVNPRSMHADQQPRPPPPVLQMCNHSGCIIPASQRLECAASGAEQCLKKGCCLNEENNHCYYPMNECMADGQIVFAVSSNIMNVTVNPMSLVVAERKDCKPIKANKDFAIFKFGVTECGTHCYSIGDTTVYLVELNTAVKKLKLKYGTITRDQPIRLMVECRYTKGLVTKASAGYMVMSASQPPVVMSEGLFGVQLRLAEDKTFSRFFPQYHQPLRSLLGKPVYLEVRLNSPNPKATLLVHYCVAYPRSAKNALVLLYEGCPNPLDSETTSILYTADLPQTRHRRRFEVKAFQFVDEFTNKYLDEEIYFMCSTEVCMPSKTPCKEMCFDGKS